MSGSGDDFSRAFYPFLHKAERQPEELLAEMSFSLMEKVRESIEVKSRFFTENREQILTVSLAMAKAFHRGNKMLVCGNGGSLTDAQHIEVEFMHPIIVGRKALPVVCLANSTMITAVANDVGFNDVYARQLIALARAGDVLLVISTSGNSHNLIQALETARRLKMATIGYTGGTGGVMMELWSDGQLDHCLNVPTASVHRIQETHVTLYHSMWDLVHTFLQHPALLTGPESEARHETC